MHKPKRHGASGKSESAAGDGRREVAGTGELKAVAQEALQLGARALDKGRAWLNEAWSNDDRRDDMAQQRGPSGRESEQQRRGGRGGEDDMGYYRAQRGGEDESWMHDKERQAARTGYADYAYDPERGRARDREYGHASADDYGRGGGSRESSRYQAREDGYSGGGRGYGYAGARESQRQGRDYGRGWREDGAPGRERTGMGEDPRHGGERGLYGAYGPDVSPRGYREGERGLDYDDSGWRAGGFDERSQTVGWEDDRGDAPGASPGRYRQSPQRGDPRHGYYVYGGESAGSGGRERLHDYDEFDPRRGRYDESYRAGSRRMGEGYGQSSGYAGGDFSASAYGAGFEPNPERSRGYASPSPQRGGGRQWRGDDYAQQGYREQGMRSYRGQGPRSYARSDERITEELNERLTEDELIDASDIEVRCSQGKVVLEGEVSERWMKHRAEDIADACGGVKDVENRIRVRSRDHAILAAGPESSGRGERSGREESAGRGENAGRANPSASTGAAAAGTGQSAGASTARTGANAGAGSNPGTGAGTSSSAGGSAQPH